MPVEPLPRDPAAIERFIIARLADLRKRDPATIEPGRPFNELGIDSLDAVTLTGELEDRLGGSIDPAELFDHPTPRDLAVFLAGRIAAGAAHA
jgi:acyl carrier protein